MTIKIYSRFNTHNIRGDYCCNKPSETSQEFADEQNINTIVNKYLRTGYLPPENAEQAFLDVSNVGDYQCMLDRIKDAQNSFLALPSHLREEFNNNPGVFLDFVNNPENASKLVELGLATLVNPEPQIMEEKQSFEELEAKAEEKES